MASEAQRRGGRLEQWADSCPDVPAIIEGDRSITWAEWNRDADRLAYALKGRGIGPGDVVAVRLHIRFEWAVVHYALAKIGCAMVGVNWRLNPEELRHLIEDSDASAIICDDEDPGALASAWDGLGLRLAVSVDHDALGFEHYDDLLNGVDGSPLIASRDPRLIIYTSGTTGAPKGVVTGQAAKGLEHLAEAYAASVRGARSVIAAEGSRDVVLVTMPMHHAAGPNVIRRAVAGGQTMVLMRRFDAEAVLQAIERHRVTQWNGVPTMYKRIAALPEEVRRRYDVSSIRMLNIGAAPVPQALKEWIAGHFGPCLCEGYGSTETGMVTFLPPEMQDVKPGSSGRPFAHVNISVRDPQGRELPAGSVGELWIRTPTTIRSYLNRPQLTADTQDAEGFFRVGDVGWLDDEGYLYITDRAKDMIITGGVNVYPAEVEGALIRHPDVQDVAVIGVPDEEFGERVKAFCEARPGADPSPDAIAALAAEHLASYKRPREVVIVERLPRNGMGKILKRELRSPYWRDRERNV